MNQVTLLPVPGPKVEYFDSEILLLDLFKLKLHIFASSAVFLDFVYLLVYI